ncbi:MAG: aminoacyl-histidine dipeptidase [Veillonella sp.]|nr:aminoacyl-histidine dipeptidase [Veillonella sp.]
MTKINANSVFEFFKAMNQIPRVSGHEQAVSNWLVQFAKDRNLEVSQDEAWNVIIQKPATPGYENRPSIILQGHIDMVGEKSHESNHDFLTDPIECIVDGEWMHANQTTLGADNGMGVAMALAVLDADDVAHGPITALFTTNEEVGMDGATALKAGQVDGQYLLNIDTEVEGEFIVSCAGGSRVDFEIPALKERHGKAYTEALEITVDGLLGGHSGMEIHTQRANANQILARLLVEVQKGYSFQLANFGGGTKHNAIPRKAQATILIRSEDKEPVQNLINFYSQEFRAEFTPQDAGLTITSQTVETPVFVYIGDTTDALLSFLILAPHGVHSMAKAFDNLVETSDNIAIVREEKHTIHILVSIRSSSKTSLTFMEDKFLTLGRLLGIKATVAGSYPAWQYDAGSALEEQAIALYKSFTGTEPTVTAVHAGLECGLLKEILPNTQMISFGPTITGAHTPQEQVHIPSVERIYAYLVELLKELK